MSPKSAALFQPLTLSGVTLPNRIGVSPMCMYGATNGHAADMHLIHLGRFAMGGAGLVLVEATAIEPRGRISHHDLGLWADSHIAPLRRIADALRAEGTVPGIQLAHAGRRASVREPWRAGAPLDETDAAAGSPPWQTVAPSAVEPGPGWPRPRALTAAEIRTSIDEWAAAARRAVEAGFDVVELHGAHGYLLHQFVSPLSNLRDDEWGGDDERRLRYPLEVVRAVRAEIGDRALLYRVSSIDGPEGGRRIEETVAFAHRLRAEGVDLVDASSGGLSTDRSRDLRVRRTFGYHADFSRSVREAGAGPVATTGYIVDAEQAAMLVENGDTDLLLLGREMLDDPNWPQHARRRLDAEEAAHWHPRFGSAIVPRLGSLQRLVERGEGPLARFGR
ncbi:NADH:flavin oxidoreductase/NADH oxidase [Microbacterium sp. CFH 31415]|uniref:NADH:flavin oxidoreductase/NADH oxidase n=1 Tax=Microbacterium sp. CFH 31415 TaxID=2921732 RepID=UPI001F12FC02|nr:NADH:flavin oxidoreductase/NADH oxidase [Microbacterium sp. CFH 31415]MCH6231649.1 NADH:flavin oxidoreductase/NADH oxidase [Microbacterium sp. CFH 31415]